MVGRWEAIATAVQVWPAYRIIRGLGDSFRIEVAGSDGTAEVGSVFGIRTDKR
jgi:hypothetical protein